jgi:hypothetical protein
VCVQLAPHALLLKGWLQVWVALLHAHSATQHMNSAHNRQGPGGW